MTNYNVQAYFYDKPRLQIDHILAIEAEIKSHPFEHTYKVSLSWSDDRIAILKQEIGYDEEAPIASQFPILTNRKIKDIYSWLFSISKHSGAHLAHYSGINLSWRHDHFHSLILASKPINKRAATQLWCKQTNSKAKAQQILDYDSEQSFRIYGHNRGGFVDYIFRDFYEPAAHNAYIRLKDTIGGHHAIRCNRPVICPQRRSCCKRGKCPHKNINNYLHRWELTET